MQFKYINCNLTQQMYSLKLGLNLLLNNIQFNLEWNIMRKYRLQFYYQIYKYQALLYNPKEAQNHFHRLFH